VVRADERRSESDRSDAEGAVWPVACNRDCGGGCPLLATLDGGRVRRIEDNPAGGPYLKGCVRGYHAWRQQQSPERLTSPLVRTGPRGSGQFREASWPEAVRLVVDGLARVRDKHGDGAVLALGGSGSCRGALHDTEDLTARFLNLTGGHVEQTSTYSSAAARYTEQVVLGTKHAGVDPATLRHSAMIVLWGANLVDCIMGCEWRARVREARRRGVPVVVVDPRRTATARLLGTEWLPVLPGTDSVLMLALLHELIGLGAVDEEFLAAHATGWEELRGAVLGADGADRPAYAPRPAGEDRDVLRGPATPEWAEGVCGVPAARIRALAREWARRRPVALIPGLSIQRTVGGEEAVRLAIALQTATGDLGRLGGSSGGQTWGGLPKPRVGSIPVPPNPAGFGIPCNDWADAVLRGRSGGYPTDVRAAYDTGGNYVVQGADVALNIRAMESLEFSVCHDLFLTTTARYCDVVLPATHWLERDDIVFTSADYLLYSHRVAPPPGQARDDYDIFADLAEASACGMAYTEGRDAAAWLDHFLDGSEVEDAAEFRRSGIHWGAARERVALAEFAADPACAPLATPSGRVELAGAACAAAGLPGVPEARVLEPGPESPLYFISPKSRLRVHTQYAALPWVRERDDRTLWINPDDAATRALIDGDEVLVENERGRLRCACRITGDVMPGVVSLLAGIEPSFDADGCDAAGSANVLTSAEPTLPSRGARLLSTLVEVRRAAGEAQDAPDVASFEV
jgi:anaerobic dimethyl sulfoxide reductase subunit A